MSGTLRTLLGARAAAVVGRQAERAVLLELAERDRPLVVAVYGIAGIGKSALLAAFAADARAHGAGPAARRSRPSAVFSPRSTARSGRCGLNHPAGPGRWRRSPRPPPRSAASVTGWCWVSI